MTTNKKPTSKLTTALITTVVLLVVGIVAYNFPFPGNPVAMLFYPNLAAEVAKPIEKELEKAGATKISSGGDKGLGPDNTSASCTSSFEIPKSESDTIELVKKISDNNGFNLTHATLDSKGPIMVADSLVRGWYYDNYSKEAFFKNMDSGRIDFRVEVNVEQADADPNKTTLRIQVRLPSYR